jgi:hypothetical protein
MHIKQTHMADTLPNLLKEHDFSTRDQQKKFSTLKGQITEMNKHQAVTRNIRKPGDVGNLNFCTFTQIRNGLTSWSFEIPASAYCHR